MCVCAPHVCLVPTEARRGYVTPGVTDSSESLPGCWEFNPGPVEEQPVLLTTEPDLSIV